LTAPCWAEELREGLAADRRVDFRCVFARPSSIRRSALRPLKAVNLIHQKMGAILEAKPSPMHVTQ